MIECPPILHTMLHAKALKQSFVEGNKTTLIAYIYYQDILVYNFLFFLCHYFLFIWCWMWWWHLSFAIKQQSFILCYSRRLKRLNKQYYIETYFPSATMMPSMHFSSYVALWVFLYLTRFNVREHHDWSRI